MLLAFLGLTSFLGFCISLKRGLHEGHLLVAPILLRGLLSIRGHTCGYAKGLTILVIAMTVAGVVHLVGTAMSLATLANLLTACLLRDSIT
jgi:hypothetical protein